MRLGHYVTVSWLPGKPDGKLNLNGDRHPASECISALICAAFEMTRRLNEEAPPEQQIPFEKLIEQISIYIEHNKKSIP